MEQRSFKEDTFLIDQELVLANREVIVDFFGDNRDTWYVKLMNGGIKYAKTTLVSREEYDTDLPEPENDDERDLPPLDPNQITEGRAKNIVAFFEEHPGAKEALLEYMSHGQA